MTKACMIMSTPPITILDLNTIWEDIAVSTDYTAISLPSSPSMRTKLPHALAFCSQSLVSSVVGWIV